MPPNVARSLCEAYSVITGHWPVASLKMLWTARGLVQMVERDRANP